MSKLVSELEGSELDYWVAKALGYYFGDSGHGHIALYDGGLPILSRDRWNPSANWMQAGDIIDEYDISIDGNSASMSIYRSFIDSAGNDVKRHVLIEQKGNTKLVAAMRALVESKFGEMVGGDNE